MTRYEVRPARPDDITGVARLGAATRARARAVEPLLGDAYADAAAVRPLLEPAEWSWVAVRDDEVVAALVADASGGRVSAGPLGVLGTGDVLGDVYAAAAQEWVDAGLHEHGLHVHATDLPAQDTLVSLGFGHQQAIGVRRLDDLGPEVVVAGLRIRPAGPEDLPDVLPLAGLISDHQAGSPVFAARDAAYHASLAQVHAEELASEEARYLVAYLDGDAVAMSISYDGEVGPLVPERAVELPVLAVAARVRGRGVGLALTRATLQAARDSGAEVVQTDWRTTNLLSSRFWPRRGFRTTVLRLSRTIDPAPT